MNTQSEKSPTRSPCDGHSPDQGTLPLPATERGPAASLGVMEEALSRDDSGLAALYEREYAQMMRVACLLVGSRAIAEEVVHDAFVSVGERWARLQNPGGYLRTTVVNGCRMALRRRATERRHAPDRVDRGTLDPPGELVELRAALERLTERGRAVIVLRYFLDLPDYEIAEIIGCREATVRSIVHRALRVLRKELST